MISELCFVHEQNRGSTSLVTERVVYTRHNDIGLSGDYMNKQLRRKLILFGHDVTWTIFRMASRKLSLFYQPCFDIRPTFASSWIFSCSPKDIWHPHARHILPFVQLRPVTA